MRTGLQISRRWAPGGPSDGDPGEGLGNEKAVPGTQLPGAFREDVEGADGAVDELGELGDARLGHHCGAAGTVGGNGAVVAGEIGAVDVPQARGYRPGAGASDGDETEAFDGAGDEFAVEAAADEDGDAEVAEAPGAGKQSSDARRRRLPEVGM